MEELLFLDEFYEDIDYLNENYDFIEESSRQRNITIIRGYIKEIFEHMIKFQYNPQRQTTRWVTSIYNGYNDLTEFKSKNKKDFESIIDDNLLDECYLLGRTDAITEDRKHKGNSTETSPIQRPRYWNKEFIVDRYKIYQFLRNNHSISSSDNKEVLFKIEEKFG